MSNPNQPGANIAPQQSQPQAQPQKQTAPAGQGGVMQADGTPATSAAPSVNLGQSGSPPNDAGGDLSLQTLQTPHEGAIVDPGASQGGHMGEYGTRVIGPANQMGRNVDAESGPGDGPTSLAPPAVAAPGRRVKMYSDDHRLTREGMIATIRQGGSVMHGVGHNRRILTRLEELPTEAELAGDDEESQLQALDNLRRQREAIDQQGEALARRIDARHRQKQTAGDREVATGARRQPPPNSRSEGGGNSPPPPPPGGQGAQGGGAQGSGAQGTGAQGSGAQGGRGNKPNR